MSASRTGTTPAPHPTPVAKRFDDALHRQRVASARLEDLRGMTRHAEDQVKMASWDVECHKAFIRGKLQLTRGRAR
jgi:hypothetical protein